MIINTHTHGNHVGGNVEFADNVEIVWHENTLTNMREMRPNSSSAPSDTPPRNIFREMRWQGPADADVHRSNDPRQRS
jgi:glyoxylase-like metal-dependent hydrolase (beta-lactamase superfamily II)